MQDDIRVLNENAVIKEIQFKTSVDALILQRSVEMIERAKIVGEQLNRGLSAEGLAQWGEYDVQGQKQVS